MARNIKVMDINTGSKRSFASLANAVTFATDQANQSWTDRTWTVRVVNSNGHTVLTVLADCAFNFEMLDHKGVNVATIAQGQQGFVGRDGQLNMSDAMWAALKASDKA